MVKYPNVSNFANELFGPDAQNNQTISVKIEYQPTVFFYHEPNSETHIRIQMRMQILLINEMHSIKRCCPA